MLLLSYLDVCEEGNRERKKVGSLNCQGKEWLWESTLCQKSKFEGIKIVCWQIGSLMSWHSPTNIVREQGRQGHEHWYGYHQTELALHRRQQQPQWCILFLSTFRLYSEGKVRFGLFPLSSHKGASRGGHVAWAHNLLSSTEYILYTTMVL